MSRCAIPERLSQPRPVQVTPDGSPALNYAFDVTPARLVTGLLTERGLMAPDRQAIAALFGQRA